MISLTAEVARSDIAKLQEIKSNPLLRISIREEKYLRALEIALPVLESQEKGGWIEWRGDVALPPVGNEVMVEVRMLGGNHMRGPAKTMRWRNFSPSSGDIIAYRVVEQERERGEEE